MTELAILVLAVWTAANLAWTLANRAVDRVQRRRSAVQDGRTEALDRYSGAVLPGRTLN